MTMRLSNDLAVRVRLRPVVKADRGVAEGGETIGRLLDRLEYKKFT